MTDIEQGREISTRAMFQSLTFYEHGAAQCQRCHAMHGTGGNVGPELGAIGKSFDRAYLLRSLIDPGADIAVGYGIGSVTLKDGSMISGIFMADDAEGNVVIKVGEKTQTINKSTIASKNKPLSGMPPMTALLSKEEARNLVAYLYSCKENKIDDEHK